jgi:hypothetical protein
MKLKSLSKQPCDVRARQEDLGCTCCLIPLELTGQWKERVAARVLHHLKDNNIISF